MAKDKGNPNLQVKFDGTEVKIEDVFEFTVDKDLDQPDMAAVTVVNIKGQYSSKVKAGSPLEILADKKTLFKGEVVGIEPLFDYGQPSRCTIRGLNAMHKLVRGRKSRTFEKMTDQDIVSQICGEVGLQAKCDKTRVIKHSHVYQFDQTDLQFIRQRAARLDYEVFCEDKTLHFRPKKTDVDSGEKVSLGNGTLERFRPRTSGANQVGKVVVRGWGPFKRETIIGKAEHAPQLGDKSGPEAAAMQSTETVVSNLPIDNQQEAEYLAQALLREQQMQYISGDLMCHGIPKLLPGMVLSVEVDDPVFTGKYYIAAVRQRFIHSVAGIGGLAHREAGYRTLLRVMRDAQSSGSAQPESNAPPEKAGGAEPSRPSQAAASEGAEAVAGTEDKKDDDKDDDDGKDDDKKSDKKDDDKKSDKKDDDKKSDKKDDDKKSDKKDDDKKSDKKDDDKKSDKKDDDKKSDKKDDDKKSDKKDDDKKSDKKDDDKKSDKKDDDKKSDKKDDDKKSDKKDDDKKDGGKKGDWKNDEDKVSVKKDGKVEGDGAKASGQVSAEAGKAASSQEVTSTNNNTQMNDGQLTSQQSVSESGSHDLRGGAATGAAGKASVGDEKNSLEARGNTTASATGALSERHNFSASNYVTVDSSGIHQTGSLDAGAAIGGVGNVGASAVGGLAAKVGGQQFGNLVGTQAASAAGSVSGEVGAKVHLDEKVDIGKGGVKAQAHESHETKATASADASVNTPAGGASMSKSESAPVAGGSSSAEAKAGKGGASASAKTTESAGGKTVKADAKASDGKADAKVDLDD